MFTVKPEYARQMGSRVIKVMLDIERPADLHAMHLSPSDPNFPEIARELAAQGYDGAQYRGEAWIAFRPDQISPVSESLVSRISAVLSS